MLCWCVSFVDAALSVVYVLITTRRVAEYPNPTASGVSVERIGHLVRRLIWFVGWLGPS